ncbi:hypothetical protein ACM9HF_01630 [Colwellia sp. RE-S-Sl-9]
MKYLTLLILLISTSFLAQSQNSNYHNNRIAISADGNNQADNLHFWPRADPDDWGGTPFALAIIAKKKLHNKLVHYSYNNFIDSPAHTSDINQMEIGVDGAIKRWNFDKTKFFDVTEEYNKARGHLVNEIAKSTAADPLFFLHMGPAEFFYRVVKQVIADGNIESLAHVTIISHSGYNDNHLRRGDPKFDKKPVLAKNSHHKLEDVMALSGNRLKYIRITDQNVKWDVNQGWNSGKDWTVWHWMKNHKDKNIAWIYKRMEEHPEKVADASDAGLVYYLVTGDENATPLKLKQFFGTGINL